MLDYHFASLTFTGVASMLHGGQNTVSGGGGVQDRREEYPWAFSVRAFSNPLGHQFSAVSFPSSTTAVSFLLLLLF